MSDGGYTSHQACLLRSQHCQCQKRHVFLRRYQGVNDTTISSSVEQNNINNWKNTSNNATVNAVLNNLSYVKKYQQLLPTAKQLCFAVANVRSARNKTDLIIDHVMGNKIDLYVLTEALLKDEDSVSISSLSPPGYLFHNCPRPLQRIGGGIVIYYYYIIELILRLLELTLEKNDLLNIVNGTS